MVHLRNPLSRMDIIQKITAELTSTLDFQEVLHRIVRMTAEAMNVKGAALRLLDEKSRQFNLAAAWGLSEEYLDKGPVIADASIVEGMVGDIVHIPNVTSDARIQYPSQAAAEGIVSILSVPMVLMNKTVGILRLYTGELRHFSTEESEFVRTLANLGVLAIEHAKSFSNLKASFLSLTEEFKSLVEAKSTTGKTQQVKATVLEEEFSPELRSKRRSERFARRKHQFQQFRPYLMRYLHGNDPNFEPVFRDLLDHENRVYDELTREGKEIARGERSGMTWEVIFGELSQILTPDQIQQLVERIVRDVQETGAFIYEMAESEKLLRGDFGGES